mmetsp:Transcript_124348/g.398179  ORF Transcript_124348/g.398179 Transcript_124348/m.398179 type:complete len:267 (+) Transcript_124348:220-1020(+)
MQTPTAESIERRSGRSPTAANTAAAGAAPGFATGPKEAVAHELRVAARAGAFEVDSAVLQHRDAACLLTRGHQDLRDSVPDRRRDPIMAALQPPAVQRLRGSHCRRCLRLVPLSVVRRRREVETDLLRREVHPLQELAGRCIDGHRGRLACLVPRAPVTVWKFRRRHRLPRRLPGNDCRIARRAHPHAGPLRRVARRTEPHASPLRRVARRSEPHAGPLTRCHEGYGLRRDRRRRCEAWHHPVVQLGDVKAWPLLRGLDLVRHARL